MSTTTSEAKPDVPGGRCYWCASQEHDSDDCAEAQRVMDECHRREFPEQYDRPPVAAAGG